MEGAAAAVQDVRIQEVKNASFEKRIASHSHINGLGLNDEGYALPTAGGFVGQVAAREVSASPFIISSNDAGCRYCC